MSVSVAVKFELWTNWKNVFGCDVSDLQEHNVVDAACESDRLCARQGRGAATVLEQLGELFNSVPCVIFW